MKVALTAKRFKLSRLDPFSLLIKCQLVDQILCQAISKFKTIKASKIVTLRSDITEIRPIKVPYRITQK